MCRVLKVSRAGFYAWQRRAPCERDLYDLYLLEKIKQIYADSKGTYGSRRIHAELRLAHGINVGRKRVERLMRANGISARPPRVTAATTVRLPGVRMAPDLLERDFDPHGPDRSWSADITYIRTWEGWLYLAHVMDLYSRRIVGWAMGEAMPAELVVAALQMALAQRQPQAGVIHHSDHGCQYTAVFFTSRCEEAGVEVSYGSKGDCFDNAASESFHATLKKELIHRRSWETRDQARSAVFEYIEGFYNRRRRHSKLGYLSPVDYESQTTSLEKEQAVAP